MKDCFRLESVKGYGPNAKRVQLTFLPSLSENNRKRISGLAQGLMGRPMIEPDGYILTPGQAKKCVLLYQAGFEYTPTKLYHRFSRIDKKTVHLWTAVAIAKKTVSQNTS